MHIEGQPSERCVTSLTTGTIQVGGCPSLYFEIIIKNKKMKDELVCTLCGYAGKPNKKARGNGLVEFLLWCFFLFPGILYSLWSRGGNKKNVCPKCGSENMIPQDTPQGQKLMSEQIKVPEMSKEQLEMQKTNNKHNLKVVGIVIFVIFILPIIVGVLISDNKKPEEARNTVQPALQQNTSAIQSLPEEPKARIETIVKNLGANYEVSIFGKNPNAKPVAPFEVIINTDAGSCAFAKQMNFDVMKVLFSDSITKKNIAKVRFNARRYLSTSLGGDDARELPASAWGDSGPTNFLKVLTQMGSGDLSFKDMEKQTWGNPLEGCQ